MRKRIEAFIPKALEAIEETGIAKNGKVPQQFNGYISSFGASMRQAGMVATVLFYSNTDSGAEKERHKVIEALEKILGKSLVNNGHAQVSREEIEDAATALKLAIRTFQLDKSKED